MVVYNVRNHNHFRICVLSFIYAFCSNCKDVRRVFGRCLKDVRKLFEKWCYLKIWKMPEVHLDDFWKIIEAHLVHIWMMCGCSELGWCSKKMTNSNISGKNGVIRRTNAWVLRVILPKASVWCKNGFFRLAARLHSPYTITNVNGCTKPPKSDVQLN